MTDAIRTTLAALEAFVADGRTRRRPVLTQPPLAELRRRLDLDALIAAGGLETRLPEFLNAHLAAATCLQHPGNMGHQVAVPEPLAAAAALIDAIANNPMAIYEMGPSAVAAEVAVIDWMLGRVGWSAGGGGVFTHGGSLANLTALAAARRHAAPEAWAEGTPMGLAIVAPAGCHYSLARAAGVLGIGARNLVAAPVDDLGRIVPAALATQLAELAAAGRRVMAVVANACATASGLYDRLRPIAEVCRIAGVWLHVDGAHGASALASAALRPLLDGVDLADSLVWDAHKMLRAPGLCAAVLVRRAADLDTAFEEEASYLFHAKDQPGVDLIHRTVECTKAGLGLKAFFALAAHGQAGVAAYVESRTALAREAARRFRAAGFAVAAEPESNIVLFRAPGDDARHLELRRALLAKGEHYLTAAEFAGRQWLRLTLMNPDTTAADIDALIAALTALVGAPAAGAARW